MGNGVLGHKIWTFEGWTFWGKEREREREREREFHRRIAVP
jgi:hypothetical protein